MDSLSSIHFNKKETALAVSFQTVDKPDLWEFISRVLRIKKWKTDGNTRVLHRTFASFFKLRHENVSADFISIRALPNCCVYRKPWNSFATAKSRSMVSFRTGYQSLVPRVNRFSSASSKNSCHTWRVTVFSNFLFSVHFPLEGQCSHTHASLLNSWYPSRLVVL